MVVHNCRFNAKKFGTNRNGSQRYRCLTCGKTFTTPQGKLLEAMTVNRDKAMLALKLLVEGNSIRSVERITELHRDTIMKLLVQVGGRCEEMLARVVRNIPVKDVQCDEIWAFVYKKEAHKRPKEAHNDVIGDAYTFVAIERGSKLVLTWHLGRRTRMATEDFIAKLRTATAEQRFQITTDGFGPYVNAICDGLGDRVDFAQLIKVYANNGHEGQQRYSPAEVVGALPQPIMGNPLAEKICTSHVERQNGSMRQWIKRLTRLSYAFSKKWGNLNAALALHFAYYNFCRIHSSLRVTPAMEAGIADRVWGIADLLNR